MKRTARTLGLLFGLIIIAAIGVVVFAHRAPTIAASMDAAAVVNLGQVREFINSPMGRYASLYSGAFYIGTKDDCDYIAVKHGRTVVRTFKVRHGEMALSRAMRFTLDDAQWVEITAAFPRAE